MNGIVMKRLTRLTLSLLAVVVVLGCSDAPTVEPIGRRAVVGLGPDLDSDGDGVPDEVDKCKNTPSPTTWDDNGLGTSVRVDMDGCPSVVASKVCVGDVAPPRLLVGPMFGGVASHGMRARVVRVNERKLLEFRVERVNDVDFEENCPEVRAFLSVLVGVGKVARPAACPMVVDWDTGRTPAGDLVAFRQASVSDEMVCLIDPVALGIEEADYAEALANDAVTFSATAQIVDGPGNTTHVYLGEGVLGNGSCEIATTRNSLAVGPTISELGCANSCGNELNLSLSEPSVAIPSLPATTDPDELATLANPEVVFTLSGFASTDGACGIPVVQGWLEGASLDGVSVMPSVGRVACSSGVVGTAFAVVCRLRPRGIIWLPGSGARVEANLKVMARTADVVAVGKVTATLTLP